MLSHYIEADSIYHTMALIHLKYIMIDGKVNMIHFKVKLFVFRYWNCYGCCSLMASSHMTYGYMIDDLLTRPL